MKRSTLVLGLFAALLSSMTWMGCESSNSNPIPGSVSGTILGMDPGMLPRSFNNGNLVNVAEGALDSTGTFKLTPEPPLPRGYHQLLVGRMIPLGSSQTDPREDRQGHCQHQRQLPHWCGHLWLTGIRRNSGILRCNHALAGTPDGLEQRGRAATGNERAEAKALQNSTWTASRLCRTLPKLSETSLPPFVHWKAWMPANTGSCSRRRSMH